MGSHMRQPLILFFLIWLTLLAAGCNSNNIDYEQRYQFPVNLTIRSEAGNNSFRIIAEMRGEDEVSIMSYILEEMDYREDENGRVLLSMGRRKICTISKDEFDSYLGSLIIIFYNSVLHDIEPILENDLIKEIIALDSDPDVHPSTLLVVKPKDRFYVDIVESYERRIKGDIREKNLIIGIIPPSQR